MLSIFISYRREDAAGYAGRLCDLLGRQLTSGQVFLDEEDIVPGQDFVRAIDTRISGAGVVIAVIGPHWLEILRARGEGAEDFVRHEIEAALKAGRSLIPVLVGGAAMPQSHDLPESMSALARIEALQLHDDRFEEDVTALVRALRLLPGWADSIKGVWIAEMQKEGQPAYTIRLDLDTFGNKLIGSVTYPTGQAVIRNGVWADTKLSFSTTHVPQFASEPATIEFDGEIMNGTIQLVSVDDNGVGRGVARRP